MMTCTDIPISKKTARQFLDSLELTLQKTKSEKSPDIKTQILYAKKYSHKLDAAHSFNHLILTHNLALAILAKLTPRNPLKPQEILQIKRLLITASLLHDCASEKYPAKLKQQHYKQCSNTAYKKLKDWDIDINFSKAVSLIIGTHSTSGFKENFRKIKTHGQFTKKTLQLAACILYDADRLQTIGLLGLLRQFVTTKTSSNTLAQLKKSNRDNIRKLKLIESKDFIKCLGPLKITSTAHLTQELLTLRENLNNLGR